MLYDTPKHFLRVKNSYFCDEPILPSTAPICYKKRAKKNSFCCVGKPSVCSLENLASHAFDVLKSHDKKVYHIQAPSE